VKQEVTMRRTLVALVLAVTPAHAQNPDEVRRLCAHLVDGDKYLEAFLACEPSRANEQGRKEFVETPWDRKIGALMACRQSGKVRSLTSREIDAFELCLSHR
jgi:hypothetical protein